MAVTMDRKSFLDLMTRIARQIRADPEVTSVTIEVDEESLRIVGRYEDYNKIRTFT